MSFVPSGSFAQLSNDLVSTDGLSGPNAIAGDPVGFTTRHLQIMAIIALSGTFPSPNTIFPPQRTFEVDMLWATAHMAVG